MNIHGIVRGAVGSVNPFYPVSVRISIGNVMAADGNRVPGYATPGQFIGAISGNVLTVTAVSQGQPQIGQSLDDIGGFILPGTVITEIVTPFPTTGAGSGIYEVNIPQTVTPEVMNTDFSLQAQVQALTFRDIVQIEGLNLQGTRRAIYLSGRVDGLVRSLNKGGDLITLPDGSVWLVAMVLEQWPDWVKCAATLQNTS